MNRVTLYPRRVIAPGTDAPYRYDTGPSFDAAELPVVGDVVSCEGGSWVVVGRQWLIPARGSISQIQGEGSLVDLIVEAASGLFQGEAELTDEERADDVPAVSS